MTWESTYTYYAATSDYSDAASDDPRVCRVEGCRKKHAYINIDGQRVYSKFCLHHTCNKPFPVEQGYHCPTPKRKDENYCDNHLKCGEPGCEKRGEYLGTSEYIQWFCSAHRCTAPSCRERAHDLQQQRCKTHFTGCSVPGCSRPCHLHRDGRLDIVCAVHYGTHKCAWPGCTRRKPGYDMKYCLAHKCSVADCSAGRDPAGGSVCSTHRCTIPYCPNPIASPSPSSRSHSRASSAASHTCLEHTCRAPRCTLPRSDTSPESDFCRPHTCLVSPCRNEARLFAGLDGGYCDERHACMVPTCSKPRMSVTGSGGGLGPSLTPSMALDRDKCVDHAHAAARGHRRSASMGDYDGSPVVDIEGLRYRFQFERERKRLSDDIEVLRRRERERELARLRGEVEEMERWLDREGRGGFI